MGLICCFAGQVLGIYWLSQNHVVRSCWTNSILCLLATLVLEKLLIIVWAYLVAQYTIALQKNYGLFFYFSEK